MAEPNDPAETTQSFAPEELHLLPADTRALIRTADLTKVTHRHGQQLNHPNYRLRARIDHPALSWYRFAPRADVEKDARVPDKFIKAFAQFAFPPNAGWRVQPINALQRRQAAQLTSLTQAGQVIETLEAEVEWRLVAGLGDSHPYENSLTLDRLFGFPYIAGSSWKGMLRGYMLERIVEGVLEQEDLPAPDEAEKWDALLTDLDNALMRGTVGALRSRLSADADAPELLDQVARVFGSMGAAGQVCFLDTLPMGRPILEADVMTPHTKGNKPTAESLRESAGVRERAEATRPNPIVFLTVGRGSRFRFAWYGRDAGLVKAVGGWLRDAVRYAGIGAKTAAGYGCLEPVSDGG
ncbi:type III-B CRISPR module RAMP protein Cmr6 [Thiococcus pfennigii]|uniref:type III-B CRISPR module RAMP protein Cmr6 n=1 Tax=Thiococcus pfennigii TaxID=1057 RepID=UPI00190886D4|nr:type III-B CRISPR module RAMP protein Cmr6 [Thiococcus pfennigii]MBK1700196.1 type III-B CRISPR module RAMP protein Cmr6 [Thiococcus pfennigii]